MRSKLLMANWKMNGSLMSIHDLLAECLGKSAEFNKAGIAIFPPNIYIPTVSEQLRNTPWSWGGQNVSEYENGAYTGEISAEMLKDYNCRYALVGHSERRQLYQETNEMVVKKFQRIDATGLIPVLCVGETLKERQHDQTEQVVTQQLESVINPLGISVFEHAVIAYEPIWAIGTGITPTPEEVAAVHGLIRRIIMFYSKNIGEKIAILYGGSVKAVNAKELLNLTEVDGGLVGGASLNASEFVEIMRCIN